MLSSIFLALASLAAATTPGSPAGARVTCPASQLRAAVYESTGAAGTIAVSLTLRNTGTICTLRGYARLQLRNARGALPTRTLHGGRPGIDSRPALVTLARNARATILISYNHVPSGPKPCPTATRLLIAPPGAGGWVQLALRLDPCRAGTIRESPILAGVRHVA